MTIDRPTGGPPLATTDEHAAPFGLPVLHELPELTTVLQSLAAADAAIARAVDQLVHLRHSGLVETATGVGLDGWLAIVARRTGTDRRMLLTVADTLGRLPHLHRCFVDGEVSWAQLRSVVLQVHRLTDLDQEALDTALAGAVADTAELEPDVLPRQVRWIVDDLVGDARPPAIAPEGDKLILQPRLDGTGGSVYGELGPVGLAALDAATRPGAGADEPARRRAENLTDLCLHATTEPRRRAGDPDRDGDGGGEDDRGGRTPRRSDVHVLLRVELETLLGLDHRPAQLLTGLAGGAMWTDAPTARQLASAAGSLRLIVTDAGAPVGVGRRSYAAPRWLRETILALHDTCTAPGCDRPALTADTDHATEWSAGGTTDVANCAPLCAHHNRDARRRAWRIEQRPDGTRHWWHPATGLTTTTRPDPRTRAAPPPQPDPRTGAAPPPRPGTPAGDGASPSVGPPCPPHRPTTDDRRRRPPPIWHVG